MVLVSGGSWVDDQNPDTPQGLCWNKAARARRWVLPGRDGVGWSRPRVPGLGGGTCVHKVIPSGASVRWPLPCPCHRVAVRAAGGNGCRSTLQMTKHSLL